MLQDAGLWWICRDRPYENQVPVLPCRSWLVPQHDGALPRWSLDMPGPNPWAHRLLSFQAKLLPLELGFSWSIQCPSPNPQNHRRHWRIEPAQCCTWLAFLWNFKSAVSWGREDRAVTVRTRGDQPVDFGRVNQLDLEHCLLRSLGNAWHIWPNFSTWRPDALSCPTSPESMRKCRSLRASSWRGITLRSPHHFWLSKGVQRKEHTETLTVKGFLYLSQVSIRGLPVLCLLLVHQWVTIVHLYIILYPHFIPFSWLIWLQSPIVWFCELLLSRWQLHENLYKSRKKQSFGLKSHGFRIFAEFSWFFLFHPAMFHHLSWRFGIFWDPRVRVSSSVRRTKFSSGESSESCGSRDFNWLSSTWWQWPQLAADADSPVPNHGHLWSCMGQKNLKWGEKHYLLSMIFLTLLSLIHGKKED